MSAATSLRPLTPPQKAQEFFSFLPKSSIHFIIIRASKETYSHQEKKSSKKPFETVLFDRIQMQLKKIYVANLKANTVSSQNISLDKISVTWIEITFNPVADSFNPTDALSIVDRRVRFDQLAGETELIPEPNVPFNYVNYGIYTRRLSIPALQNIRVVVCS